MGRLEDILGTISTDWWDIDLPNTSLPTNMDIAPPTNMDTAIMAKSLGFITVLSPSLF